MKRFLCVVAFLFTVLISSCAVYVRGRAYVPVEQPSYYTLRVFDDRYVFYSAYEPVAVWTFGPDGTFIKEGIEINGPVRVFYRPDVLFAEVYYTNGVRDGACRYYYPGGGLMYEGFYSHGYMSGAWASYNKGGRVSASFQFHGTETAMPAGFHQPADRDARAGFQSMQRESAYAGGRIVNRPFDKGRAIPANYRHSFGAIPGHAANAGQFQGAPGNAQFSKPGQGMVREQGMAPGMNKGGKKFGYKKFNRQNQVQGNMKIPKKPKPIKNKVKPPQGQNGANTPPDAKDVNPVK